MTLTLTHPTIFCLDDLGSILIGLYHLHSTNASSDDKAMVRMVFAKMQPFKGVENYFTDSLLYQENSKVAKEPSPDDIDSGNEANSESRDDPTATFDKNQL